MDVGVIVLTLVVGLFGVASAVLGFIAERTKLTWDDVDVDRFTGECDYPANPAYLLSLIAIPLLAVAMIIASLAGGCCGCCRPRHGASESKRVVGMIAAVLSWIAALLAGAFYANGAVWNLPVTRYDTTWCRLLRDGYFRLPALLSLAATALAIMSYAMLRARPPPAPTAPAAAGPPDPNPTSRRSRRLGKRSRSPRRNGPLLMVRGTGKRTSRFRRFLGTLWEDTVTVGHRTGSSSLLPRGVKHNQH
ncbi:uncharacterized protein C2845_PM06G20630 [Panicum miliaceum]|uniref:Uncharacterized protein n=1 Tax=Panicum miliaceum TaxID=4540 RepID=A0A3L6RBE2_PANMI|nr:uncharacterized protein C2845_PM06G20630 [Panicum miliaceum]